MIQLKFDSIHHLWQFKEKAALKEFEIQTVEHILFCNLSEEAIETAVRQYGAKPIQHNNHNQPLTS